MEKTNWWTIIIVAVVVAVLASLVTVNLTGNTIRVNDFGWAKNEIYTKAEVDSFSCAKAIKLIGNSTKTLNLMGLENSLSIVSIQNNLVTISINGLNREIAESNFTIVDGMKITAMEITSSEAVLVIDGCEAYW
jgi:hypothetical protein